MLSVGEKGREKRGGRVERGGERGGKKWKVEIGGEWGREDKWNG